MKQKGFTLVEVMISMFIMAMLTVLVSASIRTAVQNKKKIEARIETESMLYDTFRVMKGDIENAFNYQDVFFEIERLAIIQLDAEKNKLNPGGQPGQPMQQRPAPIKLTHFAGESNQLNFTTLNHYRTRYNAQESDQMEVGYKLETCQSGSKGSSKCIWRRSQTPIDEIIEEGGSRSAITHNVRTLRFSYRGFREDDEWVDQWRSDNKGRADHQNKFPHLVKIFLELDDPNNPKAKPLKETMVVRVLFPNNEPHMGGQNPALGGVPQ